MPKNHIPISNSSKNIKKNTAKSSKSFPAQVADKIRADLITKLPLFKFKVISIILAMNVSTIHIKWDWSLPIEKKTITEVISKYGKKGGGDYIFFDDEKSDLFVAANI